MVRKFDRKYLQFTWQGKTLIFPLFTKWLICCVFLWTKLLEPVLSILWKKEHTYSDYIDVILFQSDSYTECIRNVT